MTAELRGRLLSHFYKLRHNNEGIVPVTEEILSGGEPVSRETIAGVCRELADVGLIEWAPFLPGHVIGNARIRGPGVDAVERGGSASLEIRFPDKGVPVPTVKESERVTIAEGLAILERHLPADQAKARILRAFVQKALDQEPLFAFPYDEAEIDWATGSVKIPRKRERFCPTFSRAEFERYFFEVATPKNAPAASSPPMANDTPMSDAALTEIREIISTIKSELPALTLSNSAKADITADINQIEVETERPTPRRRFMQLYLESLRDNLAKAAGAATAGGVVALVALVSGLLAKHFGIF
jgi:hypothetical protein